MRLSVVCSAVMMCVASDNALADVRVDEHFERPSVHFAEHISLPDPVGAFASDIVRATRLFSLPADGRISSFFGWRRDPITGVRRFHSGLDLANFKNSRVTAALGGRVVSAGPAAGCGAAVLIRHEGGFETRYCHLESLSVKRGDEVKANDMIGAMGMSGRATGAHLHFEIHKDGAAIDPAARLAF